MVRAGIVGSVVAALTVVMLAAPGGAGAAPTTLPTPAATSAPTAAPTPEPTSPATPAPTAAETPDGTPEPVAPSAASAAAPPADEPRLAQVSVGAVTVAQLGKTWRRGCPVAPAELRRVTTNYRALDGTVARGSVILHEGVVTGAATIFRTLYDKRFPIQGLAELSAYGNNAAAAMRAGATFGYACARRSDGTWHPRSLGRTLALNPRQNPMRTATGAVVPASAEAYVARTPFRAGMLAPGRPAMAAVRAAGWTPVRLAPTDFMHVQAPAPATARPRVEAVTAEDLPYSYRSGCPVAPSGLRRVMLYHWGFDGALQRGEIITRSSSVGAISRVFSKAYAGRFPIRKMHRVDVWQAKDERAMAADNTSAFNCRKVTGNPYRLSQHSYGNAIDVNTVENPYVTPSRVYPTAGRPFLDRSPYRPGMILAGSVMARAFQVEGWPWGARWANPDYQHFSSNGG